MTGAFHSRELITIQMVFYQILILLGGIVNNNQEIMRAAAQTKFYFIPVVNVDGLMFIESKFPFYKSENSIIL